MVALSDYQKLSALQAAGLNVGIFNLAEAREFETYIKSKPALSKLIEDTSKLGLPEDVQKQTLTALAKKWKENPALLDKMDAELANNPQLTQHIGVASIVAPNDVVGAISNYQNAGDLGPYIPAKNSTPDIEKQVAAKMAAPLVPPTAAEIAIQTARETAALRVAMAELGKKSDDELRALMTTDTATTLFSTVLRTNIDPKDAAAISANLQNHPDFVRGLANTLSADPKNTPDWVRAEATNMLGAVAQNPAMLADPNQIRLMKLKMDMAGPKGLELLASASDAEIAYLMTPNAVKGMSEMIAKFAVDKHGVDKGTADGFVRKIQGGQIEDNGMTMAQSIANTMRNNPGFIREMASMAGNKATPPNALAKHAVKSELTRLMANPATLTNDFKVKTLEGQMWMAKMDQKQLFSLAIKEATHGFGIQLKSIMSGFSGEDKVLCMGNGSFGIDWGAFARNQARAYAADRIDPREMWSYARPGADGKFYIFETVKDKDGRDVIDEKTGKPKLITDKDKDGNDVPRKIIDPAVLMEVTLANGKKLKVIPGMSEGLPAKQWQGSIGPDGQFIQGNWQVPVITDIDIETGYSKKIQFVTMTPAQFKEYQDKLVARITEANEKKEPNAVGGPKTYALEPYTIDDMKDYLKKTAPNMVVVDAKTGVSTQGGVVVTSSPALEDRGTATTYPVGGPGSLQAPNLVVERV